MRQFREARGVRECGMPIEFYCPGCGNLMRTPDETAGRKGRCPTCQLKVQIPAASVASGASASGVRRSEVAAAPRPSAAEPIRLDCGVCGKTLSIAAANAGKKGQCPHCGALMSIPSKSSVPGERWRGAPKRASQSSGADSSNGVSDSKPALTKAGGDKIEFRCSSCRYVVRVGAAAAGKKGLCPRCQAVIQIPLSSSRDSGSQPVPGAQPMSTASRTQTKSAAPKSAAPIPGLTPLPSQPRDSNSASVAGLTPLPSYVLTTSGLTPLDEGGLKPLDDGLAPLEPLGLTPLGSDGMAGLEEGISLGLEPFGAGPVDDGNPFAKSANPYSAPAATYAIPRKPARKGSRSGTEVATMICGGGLTLYAAGQIVLVGLQTLFHGAMVFSVLDRLREQGSDAHIPAGYVVGQIFGTVLISAAMLAILAGGIQMLRFRVWGLCLTASIMALAPYNCFCIFGLPLGVWGIVMLSLPTVRAAFR